MSGSIRSLCASFRALITNNNYAGSREILFRTLLYIILTQCLWVGIYDCQVKDVFSFGVADIVNDSDREYIATAVFAVIVFLTVAFCFFPLTTVMEIWLQLPSVTIPFAIAGMIIRDGVYLLPWVSSPLAVAIAVTTAYGGGSLLATFTRHLPPWLIELYEVSNGAMVATFYLRIIPSSTAWMMLVLSAAMDILMVTKMSHMLEGPYDDMLRFVMYSTTAADDDEESSESEEPDDNDVASSYSGSEVSSSDEDEETTMSIGLGYFIMCSIFVGRSMTTGLLPALASTCGLLTGLASTFLVRRASTFPAFSVSFTFGFIAHIFTCAVVGEMAKNGPFP